MGWAIGWAMGWAEKGYGAKGELEKRAQEESRSQIMRFFMKPFQKTQLVFIDDEPLRYYEHAVSTGDSVLQCACTQDSECSMCLVGDKPYYAGAWTVKDRTEFTDKKGNLRRDMVRLFIAKPGVLAKIARKSDNLRAVVDSAGNKLYPHGLAGIVLNVARGDGKTASTGDDFEVAGVADPKLLLDADGKPIKPFDYMTVLAPNVTLLKRMARIYAAKNGIDSTTIRGL